MPARASSPRVRLRPGLRVARRGDGHLQVGLHPGERVVVADREPVRRLLRALAQGVDAAASGPADQALVTRLADRGLLRPVDEVVWRRRLRQAVRVGVVAAEPARSAAAGALAAAGLQIAEPRTTPVVVLHLTTGAEPRREELDKWMRQDRPHLPLTMLAGHTRLGPLVVPGLTACLRCVDEHLTDQDPRHPLVLAQHHDPDPADAPAPEDLQLALAWATRDLITWVEGGRPTTWSSTLDLGPEGPVARTWSRHPRCGCAWGDVLAG